MVFFSVVDPATLLVPFFSNFSWKTPTWVSLLSGTRIPANTAKAPDAGKICVARSLAHRLVYDLFKCLPRIPVFCTIFRMPVESEVIHGLLFFTHGVCQFVLLTHLIYVVNCTDRYSMAFAPG